MQQWDEEIANSTTGKLQTQTENSKWRVSKFFVKERICGIKPWVTARSEQQSANRSPSHWSSTQIQQCYYHHDLNLPKRKKHQQETKEKLDFAKFPHEKRKGKFTE